MNKDQARKLVEETFTQPFDRGRFLGFIGNLVNHIDESKAFICNSQYVKDAFKPHIRRYERLATYITPDQRKIDIMIVYLTDDEKLTRARTALRNFVADYLKNRDQKDAALVAFVSRSEAAWRFSYVKMEYATFEKAPGEVGVETRLTPARRFSYIVGPGESCHTAQTRFLNLLQNIQTNPQLKDIEEAFSVEAVTKEFFERYKLLFLEVKEALDKLAQADKAIGTEFAAQKVNTIDFAKKLMGQIVFLYFLQKKGWLGVAKGSEWGTGPHDFLRELVKGNFGKRENFFNDILEPLFYDTLATDRGHEAYCEIFKCRIPFLNGGLFEPLNGYNWRETAILLPNELFTNSQPVKSAKGVDEGINGTGILDVFDRYNFTVNEAEPLEKEVAIDPEMLGKVFENLLEVKERKSKGSFYTPREIVHYMCQESLINYLDTVANGETVLVPRTDIETLIHTGDQASDFETARIEGTISYKPHLPTSIETNARLLDEKLAAITVCDPAIGSGAFPVGMMQEIIRARSTLTPYFNDVSDRTAYHFKRHAIQNCLYGVDIDSGAVEIAKLRLWLSLVVDEEDVRQIKPLPNLDYKVVTGNSLIGFPFKSRRLGEIETLKQRFFGETDHETKMQLKTAIDQLLSEAFAASKRSLGYEVNFDFQVVFSEVFCQRNGFDVVIGNPPYGFRNVLSPVEKKYFRKDRRMEFPSGDVAELFVMFSQGALVRPGGTLSFIIPKKSLYGQSWKNVRQTWLRNKLNFLMDASQAFENVLLEQVSFSIQNSPCDLHSKISVGRLNPEKSDVEVFGAFETSEVFADGLRNAQIYRGLYPSSLVEKIRRCSINEVETPIGGSIGISNLTPHLTHEANGNYPCVKGIDIVRYGLKPAPRYIPKDLARKHLPDNPKIKLISQEIIAHVQNPRPHIVIAMFLDIEGRLLNDTCVQIVISDDRLDPKFVMAYFHSTFTNWYAHNFVFNRAIRTMHLIDYYIRQIVVPRIALEDPNRQKPIIGLVNQILTEKKANPEADTNALDREIDRLIYELYGLTPEEIAIVDGARPRP